MCPRFVHKREQEIQNIVQSISDLNVIFKDLAQMVSEQVMLGFILVVQSRELIILSIFRVK